MRQLIGVGTPRSLQGRLVAVVAAFLTLIRAPWQPVTRHRSPVRPHSAPGRVSIARYDIADIGVPEAAFTTGCSPQSQSIWMSWNYNMGGAGRANYQQPVCREKPHDLPSFRRDALCECGQS